MNTDDDPEKSEPAEAFEENTSSKDVVDIDDMAEPAANLAGVSSNFTIWAGVDNYWALLRGTYSWNPEGTLFRVVTAAYRAGEGSQGGGNGRTEGNVWVSATSAGDTGSEVLDHAIQDGSWHSLTATKTVAGDKDKGRIYFHYTYDRDNTSDKKFENETFVRYAPPHANYRCHKKCWSEYVLPRRDRRCECQRLALRLPDKRQSGRCSRECCKWALEYKCNDPPRVF